MASNASVRDFYKGRSLLITGGTGFMGKVLIEKLLYSVPAIGNIYILMRPKKGKSVLQRLEDMQRLPLFDRLRNERPGALKKLKPLQGDVLFEQFGLSDFDIDSLSNEISVVFHFAATLRLEAPLKDNVNMNTSGTLRTINVAKRFKNLAIFVHLSTAFCYPDYEVLGEKIYAPPAKPENVMKLIEWLDDKQLALLTPSLLGPHPNCYTFSKRLAENVVEQAYNDLPIVIARPSIVCPAVYEPLPGWVDNLNGPVGVMLGAGKGVIRTMLCDGTLTAQVIPVDVAINAVIAIGMLEGNKKKKSQVIPVYNVNIGHQKPTTWGDVLTIAKDYGRRYPLSWPLWYPNGDITTNITIHKLKIIFYHLMPAYCIDFLLFLLGQKRLLVRIQERISQGLEVLQYFTMRPWKFPCPNFDTIQSKLNKEERVIFNTDVTDIDRIKYMEVCVEGGRVYCLKEDPTKVTINRSYHNLQKKLRENGISIHINKTTPRTKSRATASTLYKEERVIFNTDVTDIDRIKYMEVCVEGGRVYCLKEDPTKVTINRSYHNFLYVLDWVVKIMFFLFVLSLLASWSEPIRVILSYAEPIVKHLPFLGDAVLNN